jgi:hypothetical protein
LSGAVTATISDTEGANVIQLVDGLTIASSIFYGNAVQLTLSNGAKVQILGAAAFGYQVGANAPAGRHGQQPDLCAVCQHVGRFGTHRLHAGQWSSQLPGTQWRHTRQHPHPGNGGQFRHRSRHPGQRLLFALGG